MNRVNSYSLNSSGSFSRDSTITEQGGTFRQYGEEASSPASDKNVLPYKVDEADLSATDGSSTSRSGSSDSDDKKKKEEQPKIGVTELVSYIFGVYIESGVLV